MQDSENSPRTAAGPDAGLGPWLALPIVLGLFLRGFDAYSKSLWLDEFHSLYVAWADDLSGVVERISHDFHPPAYFAILHFLQGVDAHDLRWLSILTGMLTLIPLLDLARVAGMSRTSRTTLACVFCFAPYQVLYGTELRAYPILQLAAASIAWATFTDERSASKRFWVFATATSVGLYFHYFTAIAVVAAGAARLVVRSTSFLRWRTIVLAGLVGVIAFLPWILTVESWILTDPGVMFRPESQDGPEQVAELHDLNFFAQDFSKAAVILPRTFVPMIASLGPRWGPTATIFVTTFFVLVGAAALLALLRIVKGARIDRRIVGALGTSAAAYALTIILCLYFWQRLPEQYFMSGAWGWPLAVALLVDLIDSKRMQRLAMIVLASAAFACGVCHILGASREDMRAGVMQALEIGKDRDALYTAVLAQPKWYEDSVPLRVYAPQVDYCEPADVPVNDRTVIVVTRKTWYTKQLWKWESIKEGRELEQSVQVDDATWVHVFAAR